MDRRRVLLSTAVVFLMLTTGWAQVFAGVDCGELVPSPKYQGGEKWTWRDEKGTEWSNEAIQVEGDITQIKWPSGSVAFHDKDWVIQQVRKSNGELVTKQGAGAYTAVGQKTLDFPLQVGKRWEYWYYGQPLGAGLMIYTQRYVIVACEEVATPAGKFSAFKVEVEQTHVGARTSGVLHLWYAPHVKNYVRRQYVPSPWWGGGRFRDYELIKFDVKQ